MFNYVMCVVTTQIMKDDRDEISFFFFVLICDFVSIFEFDSFCEMIFRN